MQGSLRDKKVWIALNSFVNEARLYRLNYKKGMAMCLTVLKPLWYLGKDFRTFLNTQKFCLKSIVKYDLIISTVGCRLVITGEHEAINYS